MNHAQTGVWERSRPDGGGWGASYDEGVIPVVTPEEMAAIDEAASEPVDVLIDRAASAVAAAAVRLMGGTYGRRVHVIAGKGNNGEDGRRAGALLALRGAAVTVFDAADCPLELPPADLVIDAAYGTGFHGEWVAPDVRATHVLAVDIPSGIDGLTGEASAGVLTADVTITFAALKPGLLFGAGRRHVGRIEVADIGLDVSAGRVGLVESADVARWWTPRPLGVHKWSSAVRLIAGGPGMGGAAHLSSAAAARAGAGLVQLLSPGGHIDAPVEVITVAMPTDGWERIARRDLDRFGALVIGPGLGRRDSTVRSVRAVVAATTVPMVIDGDALFAISTDTDPGGSEVGDPDGSADPGGAAEPGGTVDPGGTVEAGELVRRRSGSTVLTPHDGEFAVLSGRAPGADRVDAARRLARSCRCVALLKGPTTVIAASSGSVRIVNRGDQRLATAGTGDVLSGIIGALLACGLTAFDAAAAGAWIHGRAAALGHRHGLVASDLLDLIPLVFDELHPPPGGDDGEGDDGGRGASRAGLGAGR
ncbi:bifunctional ADP-dependent NAD(P)H-hydrate dehydratase/NAD(P)H-hydrate epimerase [soil metagenome]